MCIVFLYFDDNSGTDEYKLIIAANRDEFYDRTTRPADFWDDNPNIIGGIDLFPGKEGGTWLGISKTGRLGVLTNYRQSPELISDTALGRGHLATDFLNCDKSSEEYMNEVQKNGHKYNGFNLLTGELSFSSETKMNWFCNMEEKDVERVPPGFHGLSNRLLNFPWPKVVYGKARLTEIVKTARSKEEMVNDLFELLNEKRSHFPNEDDSCYLNNALDQNCRYRDHCRPISVNIPEIKYGTRTNTLILVDGNGHVTFIEKTLKDGVHDVDNRENWITGHHEFDILNKAK